MGDGHRPSFALLGAAAAAGAACAVASFSAIGQLQRQRQKKERKEQDEDISSRGQRLTLPSLPYLEGVIEGFSNPYNPSTGEGVILLAVAENKLSWDMLQPRVEKGFQGMESWVANYGPMTGQDMLLEPLAKFMEAHITHVPVQPKELVCGTGVAAILSNLFFSICEAGDAVLIPAPYYSAFDSDLRSFCDLQRVPVNLCAAEGYALSESALEAALAKATVEARTAGGEPRVLLLTNPHNPLGRGMSRAELQLAVDFCEAHGLHLVCDEIYALSNFGAFLPQGMQAEGADDPFLSVGELCHGQLGNRRHVIWGLSKDFCMSGLRFGVLWSQNEKLLKAMDSAAVFTSVPVPVQVMVAAMLSDHAFVQRFLEENSRRLAGSCALLMEGLDRMSLPYFRPNYGIFLWVDLRPLLPLVATDAELSCNGRASFGVEETLYNRLLKETRLVFTPGASQHTTEPGWFRICFAAVPPTTLAIALKKFDAWVEELKRGR
eukprot:TRINITY_DN43963_c0_g1_i1.p1 TRINITY_DN43963_c0_g1~~TRINITY_DN43963_c0_g1_i1.p1  ORF type:complete len:491 (+),score=70.00 TRINITY_DN43963_c0_g1_i1:92-1564(+)